MFELFANVLSNANHMEDAVWSHSTRSAASEGAVVGPTGKMDGNLITSVASLFPSPVQALSHVLAGQQEPITCGWYGRVDSGAGWTQLYTFIVNRDGTQVLTQPVTPTESWNRIEATFTFSSNYVDSLFRCQLVAWPSGNSGDTYYIAHPYCYVGCERLIVDPLDNYERRDVRHQTEHRLRNGKLFTYRWGEPTQNIKFGVEHVDGFFRDLVNSWWRHGKELMYVVNCGAQITSVQLTGKSLPVGKYSQLDQSLFKGVIELETY